MRFLLKDLVFTPSCIGCEKFGISICQFCLSEIKPLISNGHPNNFEIRIAGNYAGWLKNRVIEYKSGNLKLARGFAEILIEKCELDSAHINLVPIPTSIRKIKSRQIDTISFLAKQISVFQPEIKLMQVLKLNKSVKDQVGLTAQQRRLNIQDAFIATNSLVGNYVLIDDVVTTGATLDEAAKTLISAGANSVRAIALCSSRNLQ